MESLLARARTLLASGRASKAAALLRANLTSTSPPELLFLLGGSLHQQARRPEALDAFEAYLRQRPDDLQGQRAILTLLSESGRHAEAISRCDAWLTKNLSANLLVTRAALAEQQGLFKDAAHFAQQALDLDPNTLDARHLLGSSLHRLGLHEDAVRILEIAPEPRPATMTNLMGDAQLAAGQYAAAIQTFLHLLQVTQHDSTVKLKLGLAQAFSGELDAAKRSLADVHSLALEMLATEAPDWSLRQRQRALENPAYLQLLQHQLLRQQAHWHAWASHQQALNTMLPRADAPLEDSLLWFQTLWVPADRHEVKAAAIRYAGSVQARSSPVTRQPVPQAGRYRIGLLSSELRPHPVPRLVLPLVRDARHIDWFVYAAHPVSTSTAVQQLQIHSTFRDLSDLDDEAAAEAIARDNLDLLIDLTGFTAFMRPGVAARRPAPRQAHYLGYFNTTGAPWFDYVLMDPIMAPPGDDIYWSESVVRVAPTLWLYNNAQPIAPTPTRAELGLPENAVVLLSINSDYKMDPPVFDCWMRILHAVPDAVLWLVPAHSDVARNVRREAAQRGIAPERIHSSPYEPDLAGYLARYRAADLFLDTWCCNTGTTALDALYAGLPVLTLQGDTPSTRKGASILGALGLSDCIADTPEAYESIAIDLARSASARNTLRHRVAAAASRPPLSTATQVSRLCRALELIIEQHRAGELPAAFSTLP